MKEHGWFISTESLGMKVAMIGTHFTNIWMGFCMKLSIWRHIYVIIREDIMDV